MLDTRDVAVFLDRILIDVCDGTAFPTAGHLAACAGPAPVT